MWLSGGLLAGSGRSRGPGRELVGPAIKRARVCRKWPSYCELMHILAFVVGDGSEHVLALPRAGLITTYQDLTRLAIGRVCMDI